jgi:phytanoyl-CoA hydroxylase
MSLLTTDQVQRYHRDGVLVVPDFVDMGRCRELQQRAAEIVDAFDPDQGRSLFTTDETSRQADDVFLASASGIHCFLEPAALDAHGRLARPKEVAVNKIGHALHDLDPVFEAFSYTPELVDVAADIGLVDALALQSMYLCKSPHIGGEVGCHQDATFLYTDPITVTGFWFALEDATVDNGCLWAAPGAHHGALRQRYDRADEGGARFVTLTDDPLPTAPDELEPLEVAAGTLVILHGLLPHWSGVNTSDRSRHAYSLHCMSGTAEYPASNWLQRRDDLPLRRLDHRVMS